jgi:hypothetical protein
VHFGILYVADHRSQFPAGAENNSEGVTGLAAVNSASHSIDARSVQSCRGLVVWIHGAEFLPQLDGEGVTTSFSAAIKEQSYRPKIF